MDILLGIGDVQSPEAKTTTIFWTKKQPFSGKTTNDKLKVLQRLEKSN